MSEDKPTKKEKRIRDRFGWKVGDIVITKKPKPKKKK